MPELRTLRTPLQGGKSVIPEVRTMTCALQGLPEKNYLL